MSDKAFICITSTGLHFQASLYTLAREFGIINHLLYIINGTLVHEQMRPDIEGYTI
jgi:hypothetical protein